MSVFVQAPPRHPIACPWSTCCVVSVFFFVIYCVGSRVFFSSGAPDPLLFLSVRGFCHVDLFFPFVCPLWTSLTALSTFREARAIRLGPPPCFGVTPGAANSRLPPVNRDLHSWPAPAPPPGFFVYLFPSHFFFCFHFWICGFFFVFLGFFVLILFFFFLFFLTGLVPPSVVKCSRSTKSPPEPRRLTGNCDFLQPLDSALWSVRDVAFFLFSARQPEWVLHRLASLTPY